MNNLNTLRPEVADAVSALDETTCMTNPGLKWYATIRAELLRLARDNDALRSKCNVIMSGSTQHLGRVERAEAVLAEMKQTLDFRWKADMRAIEQWRAAHPGNELTWPDHADLCVWLMAELAALKARMADACPTDRGGVNNVSSNACSKG